MAPLMKGKKEMKTQHKHYISELYLDYVNNYLTIFQFSEDKKLSKDEVYLILDAGREIQDLKAINKELLEALEQLLAYSDKYSDAMREYGRGADELGTDATQPYYIAEIARKAIAKAKGTLPSWMR
jgi:hypothetical protein